ncbi:MAG: hypothetical protein ACTSQF_04970 [Candidatus Heimdallarchaeaceae archaeon]
MKKLHLNSSKSLSFLYIILLCLLSNSNLLLAQTNNLPEMNLSCTNFAASFGDSVLFGNSEDGGMSHPLGIDPLSSRVFYYAADGDDYGCAFVGWYWEGTAVSAQGGMNDQGLCYDLTGIPDTHLNSHPYQSYSVDGTWVLFDVLRQNANVSEVIDFLKNVNWEGHVWFQWFFADASGDMVIVSPGIDGELAFTRKEAGVDGFLTQTNFNRVNNASNNGQWPCPRYEDSTVILSEITNEEELTVAKFNEVLEAVSFQKSTTHTGYSNVFDPINKMLYLTYMTQFYETAIVNVTEELLSITYSKAVSMTDYFSEETLEKGMEYYSSFKTRAITLTLVLPITAIVLIIGGLVIGLYLLVRKIRRKKNSRD